MNTADRAYFDHAATAPLDPRVLDAMLPVLREQWGNPSSVYREAQRARGVLEEARERVAHQLGCRPAEVVFTSGGTEADNLALRGVAGAAGRAASLAVSRIEHHAVLHAAEQLEALGHAVAYLDVDAEGFVQPETMTQAVTPSTALVSVGLANNELGTIQDTAMLAKAARRVNEHVLFHTDAVQAAAWLPLGLDRLRVDLISISAHKLGGPKGAGALVVRDGIRLATQNVGGNQERNRRAGTEDVAGAVGLATALDLVSSEREARTAHGRAVAAVLRRALATIPGVTLTGPADERRRLPGFATCVIEGIRTEDLLIRLDLLGYAASSGAACTTGSLEPSHVLIAAGFDQSLARSSLRLTAGPETSLEAAHRLAAVLPAEIARLRG